MAVISGRLFEKDPNGNVIPGRDWNNAVSHGREREYWLTQLGHAAGGVALYTGGEVGITEFASAAHPPLNELEQAWFSFGANQVIITKFIQPGEVIGV